MKYEITVREFKARLSHYMAKMRDGDYVSVGGVDYGVVTTDNCKKEDGDYGGDYGKRGHGEKTVTTGGDIAGSSAGKSVVTGSKVKELQDIVDRIEGGVGVEEVQEFETRIKKEIIEDEFEEPKCDKCGGVAEKIHYEDGDEVKLCRGCVRRNYVGPDKAFNRIFNQMEDV